MQFLIAETARAAVDFARHRYESVLSILNAAWQQWQGQGGRPALNDPLYNALCDASDMAALLAERLPVFVFEGFLSDFWRDWRRLLADFTLPPGEQPDWKTLLDHLPHFHYALSGMAAAALFCAEQHISLTDSFPKVRFELTEQGYLCLCPGAETNEAETRRLKNAFHAFFGKNNSEQDPQNLQLAAEQCLLQEQYRQALQLLQTLQEQFPTYRPAWIFKQKGNIYSLLDESYLAVDCYIKSIVLGQPSDSLAPAIQSAGSKLLEQCSSDEDYQHTLDWLRNFGYQDHS